MRLFFYLFVFFFFGTKNSSAYVKSYFLEKYTIQKELRPEPKNIFDCHIILKESN